ncbi:hypothetical protein ABIB81_008277 [Bradyrhizobium sp. I1.7.5]
MKARNVIIRRPFGVRVFRVCSRPIVSACQPSARPPRSSIRFQYAAPAGRNFLRQLPDQAGVRRTPARIAEVGYVRHVVSGAQLHALAEAGRDGESVRRRRDVLKHLDEPKWFENTRDDRAVAQRARAACCDRARNALRERDFDEDQRLVHQMQKTRGSGIDRIAAPAPIVPVTDFVNRFVTNDLLVDIGRRRPPSCAARGTPRWTRTSAGGNVAVQRQDRRARSSRLAISPHYWRACQCRRARLLRPRINSCRRGSDANSVRWRQGGSPRTPLLDRLRQPFAIGAEVAHLRLEESKTSGGGRGRGNDRAPRERAPRFRPGREPTAALHRAG